MVTEPQQRLAPKSLVSTRHRIIRLAALLGALALGGVALLGSPGQTDAATSEHLMCNYRADYRTQTVSIDPNLAAAGVTYDDVLAAFAPWNALFREYHGFDIFAPYSGDWQDADILLTTGGGSQTWVNTFCNPGYVQRGNNKAIVFLGSNDAWRNQTMLAHELGHALGFADHGSSDASTGHIGYKPCGSYLGVMSYCTSPQSWFMDVEVAGMLVDGQLIRGYWLS